MKELYPEQLKQDKKIQDKKIQDKKIQDKKIQDKKIQNFKKILKICIEPKSLNEIITILGHKSIPTLKRDYIKPLVESGKLRMTIPDKPTSRNQKYVTNK